MIKNRQIRIEDEAFEELQKLANDEGRFLGKMIEILVKSYKREFINAKEAEPKIEQPKTTQIQFIIDGGNQQ